MKRKAPLIAIGVAIMLAWSVASYATGNAVSAYNQLCEIWSTEKDGITSVEFPHDIECIYQSEDRGAARIIMKSSLSEQRKTEIRKLSDAPQRITFVGMDVLKTDTHAIAAHINFIGEAKGKFRTNGSSIRSKKVTVYVQTNQYEIAKAYLESNYPRSMLEIVIRDELDYPLSETEIAQTTSNTEMTSYTTKLVNKLIENADVIVDGKVVSIVNSGDQIKCKVELQKAYDLKLAHKDMPLSYNILLPKNSVRKDQCVLIFLKTGSKHGAFIKAINDKSYKSLVYKSKDYEFVCPLVARNAVSRAQLIAARNQDIQISERESESIELNGILQAQFVPHNQDIYLGTFLDHFRILNVRVSKGADVSKVEQDIHSIMRNENTTAVFKILTSRMPDYANGSYWQKISEKIEKMTASQRRQCPVASWNYDPQEDTYRVEIVRCDREKESLFKQWIGDLPYTIFSSVDNYDLPL